MNLYDRNTFEKSALALLIVGAIGVSFAGPLREDSPLRSRIPEKALQVDRSSRANSAPGDGMIISTLVTSIDPDAVIEMNRGELLRVSTGPFDAPETLQLFVVTVYDRRAVGTEDFDQVTRFILPDGSVYETRTTPVSPTALPGEVVDREDLAPYPVAVQNTPRARRLARMLPQETIPRMQRRHATYTKVTLPVSGTWITQHNLYGIWQVETLIVKDDEVVSSSQTTFELGS